jgi:hypothetical protein
MDAEKFLSTVLSDEGYYCIVGIKGTKATQKFYTGLDSALAMANSFDLDETNAYFALGTFHEKGSRKAKNVAKIKSLFLDLDIGEGKHESQASALGELRDFCKEYKLPKPSLFVNSGYGLHVYWVLTQDYTRAEWHPVAVRLKAACAKFGMCIDMSVPADAAQVLRVPNTHNHKNAPAVQVEILHSSDRTVDLADFEAKLPVMADTYELPELEGKEFSTEDQQDMDNMVGESPYTKKFSKLLTATGNGSGCTQIYKAVMHPNDMSYDEWLHALSIAKFCEDGAQAIHLISRGYDGYSHEETEKIAASLDTPHLCSTFKNDNPEGCKGCPHKSKIKTPIRLCMEVKEATTNVVEVEVQPTKDQVESSKELDVPLPPTKVEKHVIPDYPFPYFRGANGGVYMRIKDKEGNADEVQIFKRDIYLVQRYWDSIDGPCYQFKYHTAREGVKTFIIAGNKLSSKEEFRKSMGMHDIFVLVTNAEKKMRYIEMWIEQLKETQDEIEVRTQFGWTKDNESFVIGDREVFANKIIPNPPGVRTGQYFHMFAKKGTLAGWKKVSSFYNQPNFEAHQFMFALSFGSPLMALISDNVAGGIFHIMSPDSGYGKTTGQWGGASVWGNHKQLVLKGKDTDNSVWGRTEVLKNIVLYIDELSNMKPDMASTFCYAVTDGFQKNRLSNAGQNLERMRGGEWNLLCGTSANISLLEKMSEFRALPKGEAQRVWECMVERKLADTPERIAEVKMLNESLANNYGHAGDIYMQYIIQNLATVEILLDKYKTKIGVDSGIGIQNRVWLAEAVTVYTGAVIAKQIGLIDWDLEAFYKWIIKRLEGLRAAMGEMEIDIEDLIGQYYSDNIRGILRIKSTDRGVGTDVEHMIMPDATPMYKWVARHEYDINKLYLRPAPFKEWVVRQGHNYGAIRKLLNEKMGAKGKKMYLGRGTKIRLPPQHVIEITWRSKDMPDNDTDITH